jgi:hypothetical protein
VAARFTDSPHDQAPGGNSSETANAVLTEQRPFQDNFNACAGRVGGSAHTPWPEKKEDGLTTPVVGLDWSGLHDERDTTQLNRPNTTVPGGMVGEHTRLDRQNEWETTG